VGVSVVNFLVMGALAWVLIAVTTSVVIGRVIASGRGRRPPPTALAPPPEPEVSDHPALEIPAQRDADGDQGSRSASDRRPPPGGAD